MKQCKVCGTLVHIDSNTCPSCGNHSFFVLDVKICPLCGKVNNIASSFCEQCGKQFITAQGNASFTGKPTPQRSAYKEKPRYKYSAEYGRNDEKDYEIERPAVSKSLKTEENAAERAYKDFMALKPEIVEKEDGCEYSYYLKGDADKLPVVILPKFAKAQGKNILVNIVVGGEDKAPVQKQPEPVVNEVDISAQQTEKAFEPFSAIESTESAPVEQEVTYYNEAVSEVADDTAVKEENTEYINDFAEKNASPAKSKEKKAKAPANGKSVFASIFSIILSLGLIASFILVFYTSNTAAYKTAGISPVLYTINKLFGTTITTLPIPFDNGYAEYAAAYSGGQFAILAEYVPYMFTAAAVLPLLSIIIMLFAIRYKKWAKVLAIIMYVLTGLCLVAIALSIKFVFSSGLMATFGVGLIVAGVVAFINFILLIFVYKPARE